MRYHSPMRDRVFQAARAAATERGRMFRPSLWLLFAVFGGGALFLMIAMWLWLRLTLPHVPPFLIDLLHMLPLFLGGLFVEFLYALLVTHWSRVEVTEAGVGACDMWGIRRTMTWAEMETVQPATLVGFPYLKVSSFRQRRCALFVPRYLAEPDAFQEAVVHTASPINPLRRSLEKNGTTETRTALPTA